MTNIFKNSNNIQVSIAFLSIVLVLFLVLQFQVTPAVLSGLLGYVLTKNTMDEFQEKYPNLNINEKIVGMVIGLSSLFFLGMIFTFFIKALIGENTSQLIDTLVNTVNNAKQFLPEVVVGYIPDSVSEIKQALISAFKSNINSFAAFGQTALHLLLLVLIGWLIGILIACKAKAEPTSLFIKTWLNLWLKLSECFKFVVFAQVKVAIFNSSVVTVFLFVICPIVGWTIPYSKTLVLLTFICGLLPIIGNLIANTITFIIALTVSLPAAISALVVLMLIHKLEYFIISKSLGANIGSDVWELLIVLFAGEVLFGTSGLVFAPILYAFFKQEFSSGEIYKVLSSKDN